MLLILNDEPYTTKKTNPPLYLSELIDELEIPYSVATSVNHTFIAKNQRNTYQLKENDIIDIITAMQGG